MERYDFIVEAEKAMGERLRTARGLGAALAIERANKLIQQQAAPDLRELGLTYAGWQVLTILSYARHQTLAAAKLAKRLGAHPTTITSTVDRLERDGLVTRERAPHDRRLVLIALTEKGVETERLATASRVRDSFGILELTDEEIAQLTQILRKMRFAHGDLWQNERHP